MPKTIEQLRNEHKKEKDEIKKEKDGDGKLADKAKKTAAKLITSGKSVSKDMQKEKD